MRSQVDGPPESRQRLCKLAAFLADDGQEDVRLRVESILHKRGLAEVAGWFQIAPVSQDAGTLQRRGRVQGGGRLYCA